MNEEKFYSLITNIGEASLANAALLGEKETFVDFAVGDGNGNYYNPTKDQKKLKNEVWRNKISDYHIDSNNPNWMVIDLYIPSQIGGFTVREAGIFNEDEQLVAVAKYPESYKPKLESGSSKDLLVRMIIPVSNTELIKIEIDPSIAFATKKDIKRLEDIILALPGDSDFEDLKKEIEKTLNEFEIPIENIESEELQTDNKNIIQAINELLYKIPQKATSEDIVNGTDDEKYITSSALNQKFIDFFGGKELIPIFNEDGLNLTRETLRPGSQIESLCFDDNDIYISETFPSTLKFIRRLDRESLIIKKHIYQPSEENIKFMLLDDDAVFILSDKLYKYNRNLVKQAESLQISSQSSKMLKDDDFLYVLEGSTITKRNKKTLEKVAETFWDFGYVPSLMTQDTNYIYIEISFNKNIYDKRIYKLHKSTLEISLVSPSNITDGSSLYLGTDFLYYGATNGRIYQIKTADLSIANKKYLGNISDDFKHPILSILEYNDTIYLNFGNITLNKNLDIINGYSLTMSYSAKYVYGNDVLDFSNHNGYGIIKEYSFNPTIKYFNKKER